MNRRLFFQTIFSAVGLSILYPVLAEAERRRGGGSGATAGAALIDPKSAAAKSVNYVHNLKEIKDKKLQTDRSGVSFAQQRCDACAFYQKDKETTVAGKKAAPCQMPFAAGKVVAAEGWCTSWAKK